MWLACLLFSKRTCTIFQVEHFSKDLSLTLNKNLRICLLELTIISKIFGSEAHAARS
jgi:hypothetical protein